MSPRRRFPVWHLGLLAGILFAPLRCMTPVQSQPPETTRPANTPPVDAPPVDTVPADTRPGPTSPVVVTAADDPESLRRVDRGLQVLSRGAREYPEHRQCFACHHQTLPLLALTAAHRLDLPRQSELERELVEFVRHSFENRVDELTAGEGIGGKALTVGYALWTLRLAGQPADDLTTAMVTYLLKTQSAEGGWKLHAIRPPAEESVMLETVLAAAGIRHFAGETRQVERDAAVQRTRDWLSRQTTLLHEDRVARAWSVALLGTTGEDALSARQPLLQTQRADGSWSQTPEMAGDAYATATALHALLETGLTPRDEPVQRGVAFLRQNQAEDGSWPVATRATPVQVFFDNGDPGGKDQFITMLATGWATAVLARTAAPDHP